MNKLLQLVIQLRDEASASLEKLQGTVGNLSGMLSGALAGAVVATGVGIGALGASSISMAGDFEQGMNAFKVAAGDSLSAAGLSVEDFRAQFLKIGAELPVSTSAVQEAATTLVKGGLDPMIVKMGGLESSIKFAAAAGMDLNAAAELSIKNLGTFVPATATAAEKTEWLAHAQDQLVKSAGASTLDVDKLGAAMLAAAGQATASGVAYDDFVTTMGLISPSFDSAAQAGTSYKNFLSRMVPTTTAAKDGMAELGLMFTNTNKIADFLSAHGIKPLGDDLDTLGNQYTEWATAQGWSVKEISKGWDDFSQSKFFDMDGQFVGNAQAAELLKNSLAGLSDERRSELLTAIFGNDAMGAANALARQGAEGYNLFADAMNKASGVEAAAATMQEGYNIAMDNFKGSLESLQITVGSALIPVLTDLFNNVLSPAINTFTQFAAAIAGSADPWQTFLDGLNSAVPGLGSVIGFVADNLIPILSALGAMILAVVVPAFWSWAFAAETGAIFTLAAMAPLILTIGAIGLAVGLLVAAWQNNWFGIRDATAAAWAYLQPILQQLWEWLQVNVPLAIAAAVAAFWAIVAGAQQAGTAISTWFGQAIDWLSSAWNSISLGAADAWNAVVAWVASAGMSIQAMWNGIVAWFVGLWTSISTSAAAAWSAITGTVMGVVNAVVAAWNGAIAWLVGVWTAISTAAAAAWAPIATVIGAVISTVVMLFQNWLANMQIILLAIGNTIIFLGTWAFQALLALISPVIASIVAVIGPPIMAAVQGLITAWQLVLTTATMVWAAITGAVTTAATAIITALTTAGAVIGGALSAAWATISAGAAAAWAWITATVSAAIAVVVGLASSAGAAISGALSAAWAAISSGAAAAWAGITGAISSGVAALVGMLSAAWASIAAGATTAWGTITSALSSAWASIQAAISTGVALVVSVLATAWSNVQANTAGVWSGISSAIQNAITLVKTIITTTVDIIKTVITSGWAVVVAASQNNFSQIPNILSNAWNRIKGLFTEGVLGVKNALLGLAADAVNIAGAIVSGLVRGISNGISSVVNAAKNLAKSAYDAAMGFLDAHSPSRLFAKVGDTIPGGMEVGITAGMPAVTDSLLTGISGLTEKAAKALEDGTKAIAAASAYSGTGGSGISGFLTDFAQLAIMFDAVGTALGSQLLNSATKFAETVGKVGGALTPAVEGMQALDGFVQPAQWSINNFGAGLISVVLMLVQATSSFETKSLDAAIKLTESIAKLLAIIEPGVKAFDALNNYTKPVDGQVKAFTGKLNWLVQQFVEAGQWLRGEGLAGAVTLAEGAYKILAVVSVGVEAFTALNTYVKPVDGQVKAFTGKLNWLVQQFVEAGAWLRGPGLAGAVALADAASKILSVISVGVAAFAALNTYVKPVDGVVQAFTAKIAWLVSRFVEAGGWLRGPGLAAGVALAEAAGKIVAVVKAGIDALAALDGFRATNEYYLKLFVQNLAEFVRVFVQAATAFKADSLSAAALLADSFGKMINIVGTGIAALTQLDQFRATHTYYIDLFVQNLTELVQSFLTGVAKFNAEGVAAAGALAESIGKIIGLVASGVDALSKLSDFVAPAESNIGAFLQSLGSLLERMEVYFGDYSKQLLAAFAAFGEGIQKAVGFIGPTVDAFAKLSDFVAPAEANIGTFLQSLGSLLERMEVYFGDYSKRLLTALAAFGEGIQKAVGFIGPAVEGFTKLADLKPVAENAIGLFVSLINVLVTALAAAAGQFSLDAIAAAGKFAESAGKAVGILKNGVDGLNMVSTFTGTSEAAINRFAESVKFAVAAMARLAVEFGPEATAAAKAFAQAAGESTDFLKKGVDGFKKLSEIEGVPTAGFKVFEAALIQLLQMMIRLSGVISVQMLADAMRLANSTDAVITVLKDAIKALITLGDATNLIPDTINKFVAAVTGLAAQFGKALIPPAGNVGGQVVAAIAAGMVAAFPAALTQISALQAQLLTVLAALRLAVAAPSLTIGQQISYGIAQGITTSTPAIVNAVYAAVAAALAAARAALGIASPSTVFDEDIGQMGGAGLAQGFDRSAPAVADAASRMAGAAVAPAQAALRPVAAVGSAGGGGGGTGTSQTITIQSGAITIQQQPGEDDEALANRLLKLLESKYGLRSA